MSIGKFIKETFDKLVGEGKIAPIKEFTPPPIPEDLNIAIKSGKVRSPTHIISIISDDRGEEPCYAGVPKCTIIENGYGVGDFISLLWFKRSLPRYCTQFIEISIMLCADDGPCVSGVHNSTVTTRARKDLVSYLVSGKYWPLVFLLLKLAYNWSSIWGAIDDAARHFKDAYDRPKHTDTWKSRYGKRGLNAHDHVLFDMEGVGKSNSEKASDIIRDVVSKIYNEKVGDVLGDEKMDIQNSDMYTRLKAQPMKRVKNVALKTPWTRLDRKNRRRIE
ncbi:ATP-citrate synthase beta chain protein [Vigna angularis]|nr:ATP-citrate synthase beta chain protein [Vigna angularis]